MIFAASIRFFEGRQPRFTHVPPMVRSSVITAVLPSSCARRAAANAVEPEPRITRSNLRELAIYFPCLIESVFLRHGLLTVFNRHFVFDCLFENLYLLLIEIFARDVLESVWAGALAS